MPVLLVEGELSKKDDRVTADKRKTGWRWLSVQSALWHVQAMGCIVAYTAHGEAAKTLHSLIEWASSLDNQRVVGLHLQETVDDDGVRLLMSLPFIGPKTATRLIEYAGSPAWALVALTDLHPEVKTPGVSRRRRLEARRVLGLRDNEQLLVSVENTEEEQ